MGGRPNPLFNPGTPCEVPVLTVCEQVDDNGNRVYVNIDVWVQAVFVAWAPTSLSPFRAQVVMVGETHPTYADDVVSLSQLPQGTWVTQCNIPEHRNRVGPGWCPNCVVEPVAPTDEDPYY